MTQQEIAKALGITRRAVEMAETRALKKLQRSPLLMLLYLESLEPKRRSCNIGTLPADEAQDAYGA